MVQQHSIRWGATLPPFSGPGSELPADGYAIEAVADGTNFGNPQALIEVVRSMTGDGSLAVLEGWDNREVPLRLRLSAPTAIAGPALADAEAALMAAVLAPIKEPLIYTPPATDAATNVFDVLVADLERDVSNEWDAEEVLREYRYYLLTLTCLPFARTESSVVVAAIAPDPDPGTPPVETQVDACSSFAGWSTPLGATSSGSAGGYVYANQSAPAWGKLVALTRTGAVSMGATPLLTIDVETTGALSFDNEVEFVPSSGPAVKLDPVAAFPSPIAGTRYAYLPPATFTAFTAVGVVTPGGAGSLRIHNVAKTDKLTATDTTTRQRSRTAFVAGSAPTTAAIRLWDETPAALGSNILVHTSSNLQWEPALRPWLVTAGASPDPDTISGSRNWSSGGSTLVYRIPAALLSEGTYALVSHMIVNAADEVTWSARTVSSTGADTIGSSVVVSGSVLPAVGPGLDIFVARPLGHLTLPVLAVEGDQMIELTIDISGNQTLDEVWLFGLTDGALTWLEDDDSMTWIEIRSPELNATRPSVYGGTGAKDTNPVCVDWKCQSFGTHRFDPGPMKITTIVSDSLLSQAEIEYFPRGHSHVQADWAE